MIDLTKPTGAVFSEDRKYRYALWRRWNAKQPILMCIGLNPSQANEDKNDKTISNLVEIARRNGFGTIIMCNLFGLVSTDPKFIATHPDPIGENNQWLRYVIKYFTRNVAYVWGNFPFDNRIMDVSVLMKEFEITPLCLGKNKNGSPKHPCRLSYDVKIIEFK